MAKSKQKALAPEDLVRGVLDRAGQGDEAGLEASEQLLGDYPGDARLHFLKGSMLASLQRYADARQAIQKAVDLEPGFAIARLQLGLLLLTSGDVMGAETAWGPLHLLPADAPLHLFVTGLTHMVRDEFGPAIERLREGIARNAENAPLNRDMSLLADAMQARLDTPSGAPPEASPEPAGPASAAHLLLKQYSSKDTKH